MTVKSITLHNRTVTDVLLVCCAEHEVQQGANVPDTPSVPPDVRQSRQPPHSRGSDGRWKSLSETHPSNKQTALQVSTAESNISEND